MPKQIKYLTITEVEQLYYRFHGLNTFVGLRCATMLWLSFHHGLRCEECVSLTWDKFTQGNNGDFERLYCIRGKGGTSGLHELDSRERSDLQKLKNYYLKANLYATNGYLFLSDVANTAYKNIHTNTWRKQLRDESEILWGIDRAKDVTPHALRHGCGFYMASKGIETSIIQNWLGHRDISSTLIYIGASTQLIQRQEFL